jgi:hypothetical protein
MEQITRVHSPIAARGQAVRVGVDLAKRVIQVHAVDGAGRVLAARALPRDKFIAWCAQLPAGCIVAMETSSSSHHWARKLGAANLLSSRALQFVQLESCTSGGARCSGPFVMG